jgi:hypothetical protein
MPNKDRIIILCDANGYCNLKTIINKICNNSYELEIDEFIFTNYDDYVISCSRNTFINTLYNILALYDKGMIRKIPKLITNLCDDKNNESIWEALKKQRNMDDLEKLKQRTDRNHYELLQSIDCQCMSEDSKYAHITVNLEIVTDTLCANKLESSKSFKEADKYNNNIPMWLFTSYVNNMFIRPGEIEMHTEMYDSWIQLCKQAQALQERMIIETLPSNVAKSLLPSSAAKKVQCGATLGGWYSFLKHAYLSSMGHLSKNMAELIIMICNMFNYDIIPNDMQNTITNLKKDLEEYEWLPF